MTKLNTLILDGCMTAMTMAIAAAAAHFGVAWLAVAGGFVSGLWANDFIRGLIRRIP